MNEKLKKKCEQLWVQKESALSIFEIGIRKLREFVAEGYVRSPKLNLAQTGRRVYSVEDLDNVLGAIAENRKPVKVVGR